MAVHRYSYCSKALSFKKTKCPFSPMSAELPGSPSEGSTQPLQHPLTAILSLIPDLRRVMAPVPVLMSLLRVEHLIRQIQSLTFESPVSKQQDRSPDAGHRVGQVRERDTWKDNKVSVLSRSGTTRKEEASCDRSPDKLRGDERDRGCPLQ